jgi:hypothetical protein
MGEYRQKITDAWCERIAGLNKGFWITLNSKMRVENIFDPAIQDRLTKFEPKVAKFIHHINEKCFGRRYRRDPNAKLTCLVGYEVGKVDGLIHCHILALHDGSTRRTLEEIKEISKWKWHGISSTNGREQFVKVEDEGNIRGHVWYMAKQSKIIDEQHKMSNICIY